MAAVRLATRALLRLPRVSPVAPRLLCVSSAARDTRYSVKHEWVTVEEGGRARVGISAFAADALGDIVFAQLPDVGSELSEGDECGTVESVKSASDVYSPLSGTIEEKNEAVEDEPGLINKSAEDKGWLFVMKMSKEAELEKLMDKAKYDAFCKAAAEED